MYAGFSAIPESKVDSVGSAVLMYITARDRVNAAVDYVQHD